VCTRRGAETIEALTTADGRPITLRPAGDVDREFLLRVYASTREAELAQVTWAPGAKEAFLRMQFATQDAYFRGQFPECEFLVVQVAGRDAGRLSVHRRDDEFSLVDLALLPEARGQGAGTAILRTLLAEAVAAGKPLTLHVERSNPALRLYEREGFRQVEDKGVYLFLEWRPPAAEG